LLNSDADRRYGGAIAIREDLEAFLLGRTPRALTEFDTPPTIVIAPGGVVTGRPPVAPTLPLDAPAPPPRPSATPPQPPTAPRRSAAPPPLAAPPRSRVRRARRF